MNPKVTIATITYNSSKFVRQTIESVLAQSLIDFELLISDDCSTDDTWEIIQQYKDPRIRAWRNESNLREYPNRNKTLNEAKGEYFIWIDGDDIIYPHGLEYMVNIIEAFPQSAMALSQPNRTYMVYPYELTPKEIYLFDYFGEGKPVTTYGFPYTLFRTTILKDVGGLPVNYIAGDSYIKRLISLKHKSVLICNGTAWWRHTPGQASEQVRDNIIGTIEALKRNTYLLEHKDCPLDEKEINNAFINIYSNFLRVLIKKYVFNFKISEAIKGFKMAGLNSSHMKYIFKKAKRNYKSNGTSTNPLTDIQVIQQININRQNN